MLRKTFYRVRRMCSNLLFRNNKLNQSCYIKNSEKGAILIEFVLAIPVIFSLIYYIQDLSHLRQMQEKMQFVATEISSMLQNVSQERMDKTVTLTDLKNVIGCAYLSFFPGDTQYSTAKNTLPLGYGPSGHIYCVRGESDDKASVLWCKRWNSAVVDYVPNSLIIEDERDARSLINLGENVSPSDIYEDLEIYEGEIKIIVEAATCCSESYKLSDGGTVVELGGRSKAYGFYVYPFKGAFSDKAGESISLNSVVIFTPKPGLFSETPPE